MTAIRRFGFWLTLATFLVLSGSPIPAQAAADTVRKQALAGLPYHPLVYHLDLSVLAYHLYGQTLVWPFDPYYEELNDGNGERAALIAKVHDWAKAKGAEQIKTGAKLGGYRGPGVLGGFANNTSHDPIVYRYSGLYPWRSSIARPERAWKERVTPKKITGRIRDVYMCYRKTGRPLGAVAIERVVSGKDVSAPGARDVLLAFEGGTGDKGERGRPVSQSLMGFVLLRHLPGGKAYDVHVTFRGSQNGSAPRAIEEAHHDSRASGNPDWITDLGYNRIGPGDGGGQISTVGRVHRGFARSMKSIFPQLFGCLGKAAKLASGRRPNRIYVTGHSLGGALAQHFVSAVLQGDLYGPSGNGKAMPAALASWPWKRIKLITFSSPRAGDAKWARTLTTDRLESKFFTSRIVPIDRKALAANDVDIVPRLVSRKRPAAYRVLISTDPVTTQKVAGGKHVGQTVYANRARLIAAPNILAHDPLKIRKLLLATLADRRIPPTVDRVGRMTTLDAAVQNARRASSYKFSKLAATLKKYYRDQKSRFDDATFTQDFTRFKSILQND